MGCPDPMGYGDLVGRGGPVAAAILKGAAIDRMGGGGPMGFGDRLGDLMRCGERVGDPMGCGDRGGVGRRRPHGGRPMGGGPRVRWVFPACELAGTR